MEKWIEGREQKVQDFGKIDHNLDDVRKELTLVKVCVFTVNVLITSVNGTQLYLFLNIMRTHEIKNLQECNRLKNVFHLPDRDYEPSVEES